MQYRDESILLMMNTQGEKHEKRKMIRKGIRDVSTASTFAQYDAYAKKILSHKIFLSHILKGTIQEFKDMDPERILFH